MNVQRQVKNIITIKSEGEKLVKQATSHTISSIPITKAYKIANLTTNPEECRKISEFIKKRLNDDEKYIQHISNSLELVDTLLPISSQLFIDSMRSYYDIFKVLESYRSFNPINQHLVKKITKISAHIIKMLDNSEYLEESQNKSTGSHQKKVYGYEGGNTRKSTITNKDLYAKNYEEELYQVQQAIQLSLEDKTHSYAISSSGKQSRNSISNEKKMSEFVTDTSNSPDCFDFIQDPFEDHFTRNQANQHQVQMTNSWQQPEFPNPINHENQFIDPYQVSQYSQPSNMNIPFGLPPQEFPQMTTNYNSYPSPSLSTEPSGSWNALNEVPQQLTENNLNFQSQNNNFAWSSSEKLQQQDFNFNQTSNSQFSVQNSNQAIPSNPMPTNPFIRNSSPNMGSTNSFGSFNSGITSQMGSYSADPSPNISNFGMSTNQNCFSQGIQPNNLNSFEQVQPVTNFQPNQSGFNVPPKKDENPFSGYPQNSQFGAPQNDPWQ